MSVGRRRKTERKVKIAADWTYVVSLRWWWWSDMPLMIIHYSDSETSGRKKIRVLRDREKEKAEEDESC